MQSNVVSFKSFNGDNEQSRYIPLLKCKSNNFKLKPCDRNDLIKQTLAMRKDILDRSLLPSAHCQQNIFVNNNRIVNMSLSHFDI